MKALILAAGYATRLYPLTKTYPKPLLIVNKRPIIDYILEKLIPIEDIDEIMVVTNSKFISKFRKWKAKLHIQKSVSLIDDLTKDNQTRRGAIGDMEFAIEGKAVKDDLLVIGGDNLFDSNLGGFISFIKNNKNSPLIGAYNIRNKTSAKKYGVIRVNKENRVIDFQEKPKEPKSTLAAMCLYYFPREKLGLIKEYLNLGISNGVNNKLEKIDATGLYIDWLRNKCSVYAFVFNGRWYDIGDYKFYSEAKQTFTTKPKLTERKRT